MLIAYVRCLGLHGASNPAHMTLLHREAVGGTDVGVAMYVGAVALVLSAPCYLATSRRVP